MKILVGAIGVLVLVACSSSTEGDGQSFACAIGELTGTWRISYAETDGNCGDVADETAILNPDAEPTGEDPCTYASQAVSADKCRIDLDYTCPLTGASGSQRWVGAMKHTAKGTLTGSMTLQATGAALCRSTYDVTWTQQ